MRKANYPYRIMAPLPHFKKGGYLDMYLQQMYGGGEVPPMTPVNMSSSYMPKAPATMSGVNNPKPNNYGDYSFNSSGLQSGAINSALAGVGSYLNTGKAGTAVKSLADSAIAYADPTGIAGAVNQAGNILGDWAKTDYKQLNEFGEVANSGKSTTGTEIGFFINPLDRIASGLNGEGWTGSEVTAKQNAKGRPQREAFEKQQFAQTRQRELNAGNAGNYWNENQMMMAAYGGAIPVVQNSFEMRMGGPISKRYGMSRTDLPQLSNYNSGIDLFEDGGEVQSQEQQMNGLPQITEYNEGGQHGENPNGGVPVDEHGNKVVVSGNRPVASVEQGEISWWNPKTKSAFIFSNKMFV